MKNQDLLAYRRQLFRDAVCFKKPDRIPILSMTYNWVIFEAGLSLTEAHENPWLVVDAQKAQTEKYSFDLQNNALRLSGQGKGVLKYTGPGYYRYHEDTGIVDISDVTAMSINEFGEYMKDPNRFLWETVLPRKYSNWNNMTMGQLVETIDAYRNWQNAIAELDRYWCEECGYPKKGFTGNFQAGIDWILNFFCGIKGTCIAMRRQPEYLKEICDFFDEPFLQKLESLSADEIPNRDQYAFEFGAVLLAHNFLNTKQFAKYYWPCLKRIFDNLKKDGMMWYLWCEGEMLRFSDFFQDAPKGVAAIALDSDDVYDFRRKLPNLCICGGLTTTMLGNATPDQCVSKVKSLIEDLGSEGGLILAPNKMLSFMRDAKPDNMKAVCDYVTKYQKKEEISS